jgi:rsbT co-antagonist protein RsbR
MSVTDPNAAPQTLRDHPGMKDFFRSYEQRVEKLNEELMAVVRRLPSLEALVRRMTPDALAESNRLSMENMRKALVGGDWGPLFERQRSDGASYAAMGIPFREWFDLVAAFQSSLTPHLIADYGKDATRLGHALTAMTAYIDAAMSNIGEEYLKTKERIIAQQQHAIHELSTPVLKLRDRLLLVPLVGILDTQRARLMTEQLLRAVRAHRAKVVVVDITGVPAVDSKVANHLFQTAAAARLMGAQAVITGLSADVAQALVALGVDVGRLSTVGDLQGGLEEAERVLGFRVAPIEGV